MQRQYWFASHTKGQTERQKNSRGSVKTVERELQARMANGKRVYCNFCIRYAFVIAFITAGAAIFKHIEKQGLEDTRKDFEKSRISYKHEMERLRRNWSYTLNVTVDPIMFELFTARVRSMQEAEEPQAWTWTESFHFAYTVMSTIGEQHL